MADDPPLSFALDFIVADAGADVTRRRLSYQIVFLFGIVRYESTAKNIFCIENRLGRFRRSVSARRRNARLQYYDAATSTSTVQYRLANPICNYSAGKRNCAVAQRLFAVRVRYEHDDDSARGVSSHRGTRLFLTSL